MTDQFEHADRLVRKMAAEKCLNPLPPEITGLKEPIDCQEVFVCGGRCVPCSARLYVERYPQGEIHES